MRAFMRCFALLSAWFLAGNLAASEPPPGFQTLFNGSDLDGWRGGTTFDPHILAAMPEAERTAQVAEWTATLTAINPETGLPHWRVEDGVLVNDGMGGYLTTIRDYGDFELLVDYRITPDADSGVYLRGVPQVQIWNPDGEDSGGVGRANGSGGLWNNSKGAPGKDPLMVADRSMGAWNHFRILMIGERVSVWLNGHLVVDNALLENRHFNGKLPTEQWRPIPDRGPIQLQTHGGEVRWCNLFIREIDRDEAGRIQALNTGINPLSQTGIPSVELAVIDGSEPGWVELGESDFVNVNCHEDTWTWRDGAFYSTGQPIGVMRSAAAYTNFELILEWRHMKSGGNSGVFLWVTEASLLGIEPGQLPRGGIEVQILDHGYHALHEARTGKPGTFFSTHGDVFAVKTSSMSPFSPHSPNGSRSFPRLDRTRGVGEWNHYYVRAINGEVRLWVNGVEVSGGTDCTPREGYLCLESEGSPIEFRKLRIRELP